MKILLILTLLSYSLHDDPTPQQAPAAVVSESASDSKYPPALAGITIPSHGVDMDATFYLAAGAGPHPTVLLLHGLPGYETNGDLAQSIRRAGWNVLLFHYRGTWGTSGDFSTASAIEDTASAVHFLRDPSHAAQYRSDTHRVAVVGHSLGGFLAGYQASHDLEIIAVAMISAVNLGTINDDPTQRELRLQRWNQQLHPVHGAGASQLFAEALRHSKEWDYRQWADSLRSRPVLLVEADDQNRTDMQALATALRNKNAPALTNVPVATDHSFSDHRIALQSIVVQWLNQVPTAPH